MKIITTLKNKLKKINPATLSALVAIVAVGLSSIALFQSHCANELSEKTLEYSQRPYVNIGIEKFKKNNSYFHISRIENTVTLTISLKLENVGNTPAKDITAPKIIKIDHNLKENTPLTLDLPPIISLGPGQSCNATYDILLESDKPDAIIKEMELGKWKLDIGFVIQYTSILDDKKTYKTKTTYEIRSNEAILIENEMS